MRIPRPRAWLLAVGVFAYLLFLLVSLPAGWFAYAVDRGSQQRVLLLDPHGTAWHGNAELLATGSHQKPVYLGTLHWRVNALRLLTLTLAAQLRLEHGDSMARANVDLRHHDLLLRSVRADVELASLAPLLPPVSLLGMGGQIRVQASQLTLARRHLGGAAQIDWDDATAASLGSKPFGSYHANIHASGDSLEVQVNSTRGALRIQGSGSWNPFTNGLASFTGTVQSTDPTRFPARMLAFLGPATANGARRVHYQEFFRLP